MKGHHVGLTIGAVICLAMSVVPALAAGEMAIDGRKLNLLWAIPFAGVLLSIAILPLATPQFWHHHFGKVAAFWALAFIVPLLVTEGAALTLHEILHTALLEYIPFIILIAALFTVAGGVLIKGNLHGSPATNTAILAIGTGMASFVGTTGASMLMIRPLLRANDDRVHNAHTVVFFIFLVSNIGGALTPLGDPPLFLGFLKGVDFFWPTKFLWQPTLLVAAILLVVFFFLDTYIYNKEGHKPQDPTPDRSISIEGKVNFLLLGALLAVVLWSGAGQSLGSVKISTIDVEIKSIIRDVALVSIAALSLWLTARETREANEFNWGPVLEVAKLFAAIFLTIIPVIAILRAGKDGSLASLLALVSTPGGKPIESAYFWLAGGLSSFLDNAPTYLVFFNAAGGNPQELMGQLSLTLMAISAGAVFMGANTYIGNAPNFMVKSIAESAGVKMPSFFGYMLWSGAFLLPCFVLVTFIFFR
jgi:Na+/H+ antiporter NhaD/arsenite permease-like protein